MATPSYDENNSDQQTLIDRVEYRADQVTAQGQSIGLNRESVFDEMVEAGRIVLRKAPMEAVLEATVDGSGATVNNVGAVYTEVELPDDFIRFLSVKLAEWKLAAFDLTDPRSDLYRTQFNSRSKADTYKPIAALSPNSQAAGGSSGKQALHCFPQDSTPTLEKLEYVGTTAPASMPEELIDAMLWETTGRALQAQKEDGAAAAYELAQKAINNLFIGLKGEEIPTE